MATAVIAILFLCACLDHGGRPARAVGPFGNRVFRCIAVIDGDTILIDAADREEHFTRVRLRGIDAPETTPPMHFGEQARGFLRELLLNRQVRLEIQPTDSRDAYGRLLAYVMLESSGVCVNATLLRTGHAYADTRFRHPRRQEFMEQERRARQEQAGLWSAGALQDMPPWRRRSAR